MVITKQVFNCGEALKGYTTVFLFLNSDTKFVNSVQVNEEARQYSSSGIHICTLIRNLGVNARYISNYYEATCRS